MLNLKTHMKLTNDQKKFFAEKFLERYLDNGFGSMSKRDVDVLIFHLISYSEDIRGMSNYHVGNVLRISETRVKSLKMEASLKYAQPNHKDVIASIIQALIEEMKKPEFQDGYIEIGLEDPVQKRELEEAIKRIGHHVEYGINREILKIKPLGLLEIIMDNVEDGEKEFKNLIKDHVADEKKQKRILDSGLTFRQKLNRLGNELSDKADFISLLATAVKLII